MALVWKGAGDGESTVLLSESFWVSDSMFSAEGVREIFQGEG